MNIFEACLKLSYFPKKWKLAQFLTLPKPNKEDYTDPSAYRPISLLPVLGKSLENIILRRMQHFASQHNWFNSNKHGFSNGLSTVTAIDSLTRKFKHGFNCKAYTVCRLLDIKGAFDNAWHDVIIRNLASKNCPAYLLHLVRNFLLHRSTTLKLNETTLTTEVENGCPQGSLLFPFLWNIVMDEALNLRLPSGVKSRPTQMT